MDLYPIFLKENGVFLLLSRGLNGEVRGWYDEYYFLSEWMLEDPGVGDPIDHLLEDGRVSLYEYLEYYDEGDC